MSSGFYDIPTKQFRWNWGAFSAPAAFGVANRTGKVVLAFLPCLIPCAMVLLWVYGIVPPLIPLASIPLLFSWNVSCGLFAESWVWATGQFEDGATFRAVMDSWDRAGRLRMIVFAAAFVLVLLLVVAFRTGLLSVFAPIVQRLFPESPWQSVRQL